MLTVFWKLVPLTEAEMEMLFEMEEIPQRIAVAPQFSN